MARGCSLSSPDNVLNVSGDPFPIYGPWMVTMSKNVDYLSREGLHGALLFEEEEDDDNGTSSSENISSKAIWVPKSAAATPGEEIAISVNNLNTKDAKRGK
uniref:Uncharacterized protein n=1 Tax=Cannabis sativa TaxID=3483 RepID=A0A803QH61_CANSA